MERCSRLFARTSFLPPRRTSRTRAGAEAELDLSLKRMRTDYVDLWQIHVVGEKEEVEQIFGPGGAIEAFEAAKKAGKCRFIGFTGHHDPHVHLAMLKDYDKFDSILMPMNVADPGYLSFEKLVLPVAVERGMGIQGMKNFGNAKLLQDFSARDCLSYVLSLPISCTAIGCTTIGQLEDDVRVAQQFKPLAADEMDPLRQRAQHIAGPHLEDWKRNTQRAAQGNLHDTSTDELRRVMARYLRDDRELKLRASVWPLQQLTGLLPTAFCLRYCLPFNRPLLPPKSRTVRRPHVNAFGPPGDVVILLEPLIDFGRAARRRHEHFAPGAIGGRKNVMRSAVLPSRVRNNRNIIRGGQRADMAQLAQPSTPGYIRLPNIQPPCIPATTLKP